MKKQINKSQKGFTLVELLAAVIVLIAIGVIIAGMISSSLRGVNKINSVENIRQNGNYALNQMSKDIQYAQIFNGLSTDGNIYVTRCSSSDSYKYIKITPFDEKPTIIYQCDGSDLKVTTVTNGSASDFSDLVDTNSLELTSCSLTCTQVNATDVPIIKIGFTLRSKKTGLAENSNQPITFETSIIMRNYKK